MNKKSTQNPKMFLPYYIDKNRLLDIYSILFGGYEEYVEISSSTDIEKANKNNKGINGSAGFSLINIGGGINSEISKSKRSNVHISKKRVQTLTSMLDIIIKEMLSRGYIKQLSKTIDEGTFSTVSVRFKKNSVKGTIDELISIINLLKKIDPHEKIGDIKQLKSIADIFPEDYGIELVSENDDFSVIGYANWDNLYQATPYDIINSELICLCQIKNKYEPPTSLLRHSMVPKMNESTKAEMLSSLENIIQTNSFSFDSNIILEIDGKLVYEVEIIALYKMVSE